MKRYFFSVFFIFLVFCSFFTGKVLGANTIPEKIIPCDEEKYENPEFNSLRPYQGSPCGDSIKASYCNNDYIIEEKVSTPWNSKSCSNDNGSYVCKLTTPKILKRNYEIGLSDVKFPIVGNTQEVANSQNGVNETMDDAQKMNEYLNWYLSGTNQKAEYGKDSQSKTVDFSGPVKKLLPQAIADFQRFSVLHDAGADELFTVEGPGEKQTEKKLETSNHNQIAVCTKSNPILGTINSILDVLGSDIWFGSQEPIPCYDGGGQEANGSKKRLVQWWDGKQADYLDSFKVIEGWNALNVWDYRVPPFPWQFEKPIYYEKAYNEWRGKECVILFSKLLCVDLRWKNVVDFKPNVYADLYQYIPLADTPDKLAKHPISGVQVKPYGKTEAQISKSIGDGYKIENEPILYYPHTRSVYDLLTLLNKTHSTGGTNSEGGDKGERTPVSGTDYEPANCEVVDVRANSGDDLTFDNRKSLQKVYISNVNIEVNQIECDSGGIKDFEEKCNGVVNPLIPGCLSFPTCETKIKIEIPTSPKIPYAENIYQEAVIGSSAFRKIFPKIGAGAPVSCIADIPSVSNVTYTPNSDTKLTGVDTPAGLQPLGDNKLYFPHFGSSYEYFLKGIQTALRPQGYGEPITDGKLCRPPKTTKSICSNNCRKNPQEVDLTGVREKFVDLATRWCGSGNPRIDMYDTVVNSAISAGMDPVFALSIWLNESGASNYACVAKRGSNYVLDFGVNLESIKSTFDSSGNVINDNFQGQLENFVGLPGYYYSACDKNSTAKCPMEYFGAMFSVGQCDPTRGSNSYISGILDIYNWFGKGQAPCYPTMLP